ncbi:MAG: hypothetical protein AB8B81_02080 [Halioglobus sp.]
MYFYTFMTLKLEKYKLDAIIAAHSNNYVTFSNLGNTLRKVMRFKLSAIAIIAAASQFSVAEMPNTIDPAVKDLPVQQESSGAQATTEGITVDSGKLPGAIIKVADSLETKLEQRLQASFDAGFTTTGGLASAH